MANRGSLGGGDRLASGRARSAQFAAGVAKVGEKIQINKGILAAPEDRRVMEKEAAKEAKNTREKPVMKRIARPLYDRVLVRPKTDLSPIIKDPNRKSVVLQAT